MYVCVYMYINMYSKSFTIIYILKILIFNLFCIQFTATIVYGYIYWRSPFYLFSIFYYIYIMYNIYNILFVYL